MAIVSARLLALNFNQGRVRFCRHTARFPPMGIASPDPCQPTAGLRRLGAGPAKAQRSRQSPCAQSLTDAWSFPSDPNWRGENQVLSLLLFPLAAPRSSTTLATQR